MPSPYSLEPIEEDSNASLKKKFADPFEKKGGETGKIERQEKEKEIERKETSFPIKDQKEQENTKESTGENQSEKAFLEEIKNKIQSNPSRTPSHIQENVQGISQEDEETRVQKLVAIAKEEGLEQAFQIALKMDDLYIIDRLHDTLSGKLYDELVSQGVIERK